MPPANRTDETVAACPEWLALVEYVKERRSVRGLPKPPPGVGYHKGAYYTCTSVERNDRTVRRTLKWCWQGRALTIGAYTEPPNHRDTYPVGKLVQIGTGEAARYVRVALVGGLPYPVPVTP